MRNSTYKKGQRVRRGLIRNGWDNFLPVSYPVKAPPAEKNEKHIDPNYHLGAHGASLPSEVGGERINTGMETLAIAGPLLLLRSSHLKARRLGRKRDTGRQKTCDFT